MATHCVQGRGVLVDLSVYGDFSAKRSGVRRFMRILDDQRVEIERRHFMHLDWVGPIDHVNGR